MENNPQKDTVPAGRSVLETALGHRSIRSYKEKSVSGDVLAAVLAAGRAASTSSFMQCVHIIRVTDPVIREALCTIAAGQAYVREAPEFLVFCIDYALHKQIDADAQVDWTESLITGAADTGIMAQNCLLAAESMGLGGVYIGSLRNNIEKAAELLALPDYVVPVFGMCLGYPDQDPVMRPRLPLQVLVSENRYAPAGQTELDAYDKEVAAYYAARGSKVQSWSAAVKKHFGEPVRNILPFLQKKGLAKR